MPRPVWIAAVLVCIGCAESNGPMATTDAGSNVADAGSSPDAATVEQVTCDPMFDADDACGGDLEGSWQLVGVCGTIDAVRDFQRDCPEAQLVREMLSPRGTLQATADGRYRFDATIDFDVDLELPVSCVDSIGGCGGFALVVGLAIDGTANCETVGERCECRVVGRETQARDGTYVTAETTFTSSAAGKVEEHWYCSTDDTITFREIGQDVVFALER